MIFYRLTLLLSESAHQQHGVRDLKGAILSFQWTTTNGEDFRVNELDNVS